MVNPLETLEHLIADGEIAILPGRDDMPTGCMPVNECHEYGRYELKSGITFPLLIAGSNGWLRADDQATLFRILPESGGIWAASIPPLLNEWKVMGGAGNVMPLA